MTFYWWWMLGMLDSTRRHASHWERGGTARGPQVRGGDRTRPGAARNWTASRKVPRVWDGS
jgi:hypothetical protein